MDCEKVKGDKQIPVNSSATIIRRAVDYYICHPKTETFLANLPTNATVATVVHSTQTITCGDGSSSDCLREDYLTEAKVKELSENSELLRYFDAAPTKSADLILQFIANDQASSSRQITLQVQDSNSGAWVYFETRAVTDLENDVNRLINHFLAKCERQPLRSTAEMERRRQCAVSTARLSDLKAQYATKRAAYDFKLGHPLDAQMEECNLHWKEFVCLKHDDPMYASNWNDSYKEMKRKTDLEWEALRNLEKQIYELNQSACK